MLGRTSITALTSRRAFYSRLPREGRISVTSSIFFGGASGSQPSHSADQVEGVSKGGDNPRGPHSAIMLKSEHHPHWQEWKEMGRGRAIYGEVCAWMAEGRSDAEVRAALPARGYKQWGVSELVRKRHAQAVEAPPRLPREEAATPR